MRKNDPYKHTGSVTANSTINVLSKLVNDGWIVELSAGQDDNAVITLTLSATKIKSMIITTYQIQSTNGLLYGLHQLARKIELSS